MRNFWLFLHRWTGLLMAGFLIVVGATGSLLAFMPELNRLLAPQIYPGPREGKELALGALARRAETLAPAGRATQVSYVQPGTARVSMTPRPLPLVADYSVLYADPVAGDEYVLGARPEPPPLGFDYLFLDSVTGDELGRLDKEPPITSGAGVMPFIDRLHFRLAMGEWGGWILGIVAVVWTIDCFNGLYLTLPISIAKGNRKSWLERWKPSWLVKLRGSFYRVNLDLHRAFGLWLFAVLLLFGWSSVYFNMRNVYDPVMRAVFDFDTPPTMAHGKSMGAKAHAAEKAPMSFERAQAIGESHMAEQARDAGFTVERPFRLTYQAAQNSYTYAVRSSRDVGAKFGRTSVVFDAATGAFRSLRVPTGQHSGNTFTTWIVEMHLANLFGLWFRIFVCVLGLGIVMLSVTGVYIWWKKRSARVASAAARAPAKPAAAASIPAMACVEKSN
ncbi:MAG TPA: PepSY-associated TM helix domain-containing protein [Methylosinus sp.]|uniref:PepSY-associated TM helix domain-containing protein n=1 Tax=Methylosinus sp. TaxID=427 RepID=UPI002F93E96E